MSKLEQVEYTTHKGIITIRHAEVKDAEKLIKLIKKVEKETTFLLREPDEFILTVEEEEKFIQSQLDSEVDLTIIAEIDGKIVGICSLNGNTRKRIRHCAKFGIAISIDYCGMGIGKKMMEACINWARENRISRITLEVDTNNFAAISLYMKLGFEIEGTFKNDKLLPDGSYTNGYGLALLL
ncbi:GNAT family N-acetyltransferase [Clostridium tagluense]|uniref:GNAT family N-acetyltransferase n=1 Tax=Clostridium tagluense TaxID=360422 RepID=UPI001CF148D6|nr:GNAT family N-acetyltransferase [Clostridium tagluense]MCB2297356.1 GNAT family N-acetyltransferase [Clostridium tagluense]